MSIPSAGRYALAVLCLAIGLSPVGCSSGSSGPSSSSDSSTAGLSHPERLRPSPVMAGAKGWVAPNTDFKPYDKIILDRILVRLDDQSAQASIDPVTLAGLVEFFRQAIVSALQPQYTIVEEPGPGTLIARIILVDLVPTDVTENVVMQVLPFGVGTVGGVIMSESSGKGYGSPPYLGQTGITLQVADSQTNRPLAEFADTQFGKQLVIDMHQGAAAGFSEGTKAYMDSFSTWSYTKDAFAAWAQFFRKRLDQLRAGTTP